MWKWFLTQVLTDQFAFSLLLMLLLIGAIMTAVAYCILAERKISAWCQDRYGPNRVGPYGLLQPLADGLKFLLKEDIIPGKVDRALFLLAPCLIFMVALLGFAIIPWGGNFRWPWMDATAPPLAAQVARIDIGLLYLVAFGSLGVYGVVLGGWASNNKYSFYGSLRAAAQMLSYEVPMGLALLIAVLATGHLRLEEMVRVQSAPLVGINGASWTVLYHPFAALILFVTALAETNRLPFDLAECEQELVGGYHTEYSAMKLAMFFLGEYTHMITASALIVAMYFGGYLLPGCPWVNESLSPWAMLVRLMVFGTKVALFIALYMIVRWTLPRLRFDQLMRLAWKSLVPMTMALAAIQGLIIYFGVSPWWALAGNVVVVVMAGWVGARAPSPVTGRQQGLISEQAVI